MKNMRTGLLTSLLLLLLAVGASAQTADVPPGHWAYEAVQTLLSRGYLSADDEGLFRGDEPVSRFDLAAVVARMLEDIEAGKVQIETAADVEMLRRLESEFRAELVQWHAARAQLEEAHARTQRQVAVIDEQLNNILLQLEVIDAALATAGHRLDGHDEDVAALQARLAELTSELAAARDQLQQAIDGLSAAVTETLAAYGVSVDEQFAQQMTAYGELAAELEALQARIDEELVPLHNRLSEQGAAMFLRLNELDATLTARTDELAAKLEALRQALTDEYGARLDEQAASFSHDIALVRDETTRLDDALAQLQADVERSRTTLEEQGQTLETLVSLLSALEERTTENAARFDNDVAELRAIMAMLDARIEEVQQNLRIVERHTATLTDAVRDVMTTAAALREDVDALQARVDVEYGELRTELKVAQAELASLQGVLGASEEQIAALTERVRRDLDDQLALTLAREQQLERQLSELQAEFNSYRDNAEEELQRSRSMSTIGIGVAVLALLLGLVN